MASPLQLPDSTSPDWDSMMNFSESFDMPSFDEQPEKDMDGSEMHGIGPYMQIPTPPSSHIGSPSHDDDPTTNEDVLSLSTTFYPGFRYQSAVADLDLVSSDSVHFHVHTHVLMEASDNRWHSLFPPTTKQASGVTMIRVNDESAVLNVVLHTIYNMSCVHFTPSFSTLVTAVARLAVYGVRAKSVVLVNSPLYTHLLGYAPRFPLDLYAVAAHWDLSELATETSSHLVSCSLCSISDEQAAQMGPIYLKRLFFLHLGRIDALKRILQPPPDYHRPTALCDFNDQKRITRAWGLAAAYLIWDAKPELAPSRLQQTMGGLADHIDCEFCKLSLANRTRDVVNQWSMVKVTIA